MGGGSVCLRMDRLGLVIMLSSLTAIIAACWVAVRCGIKPPIEREGEDGWEG
jgi:hypothetical protein